MIALLLPPYLLGLFCWLGAWAWLWSVEPPERFDPLGVLFLMAFGLLWPLALVLGVVVLGAERVVLGRRS